MVPIQNTENTNSILLFTDNIYFKPLPLFDFEIKMKAKVFRQEGDLKYEYNPFRNIISAGESEIINGETITKDVGKLKDFRTRSLNFSLNNPIDITIQPSYDGTVNLILNDDKNPPRIINSRFTPMEDMTYKIIDRTGNNDTNLYDENFIEQSTRLFKTSERIPYVEFVEMYEGGSLQVGNYTFYFKYVDADGNESDIIAESGIISCHLGKINDPFSIRGGLINENSGKIIKLKLGNIDTSYDYINVYYSRVTSDYAKEPIKRFYKLLSKKNISNQDNLELIITGLDATQEISIDALNIQYNIVDKVKTQVQVQNMLFLANVDKPTVPNKELQDLALRIYPFISNNKNIGFLKHNYEPVDLADELFDYEYYNVKNIYNYLGYWNKEIYRFGVVFIMKDDSLSPVFSVRGVNNLREITPIGSNITTKIGAQYTYKPLYDDENKRSYIEIDDSGFIIDSSKDLENANGVIRINYNSKSVIDNTGVYPLGIDFYIEDDVLEEINKYTKGFFFVRQKRIPTILAQAVTIGVDNVSNTPTLFSEIIDSNGVKTIKYFTESFIDKSRLLTHDFRSRILTSTNSTISGMLSPEVTLRSEFFNNLFTGANYNLSLASFNNIQNYFTQDIINTRHFYIKNYDKDFNFNNIKENVKLTLIEDNQPLRFSGTKQFSTRAGIPEEAWRFSYFSQEDKSSAATYLIRGAYSSFIGQEGFNLSTKIVDIHTPGYNLKNLREYFIVRFNTFDPFFAISNRYDLNLVRFDNHPYKDLELLNLIKTVYKFNIYRGDCFISNVTMRMQRNFQDPDVPISDTILDNQTWKNNYKGFTQAGAVNNEDLNKINRNDVNAIEIGHWVTFKIASNVNLNFRNNDESNSAEYALTGKHRSFYPVSSMSTKGENKIPESTLFNAGYNTTLSDKIYYPIPDVPFLKNIYDTRIMFSDIHITDAFRNGYRIFQGLSYKDVTRQYGGITKIYDMKSNLLVIFERGIGIFPINEKAMIPAGESGEIFVRGLGVLPEKPQVISDIYGSMWQDSIIRTDNWIYGVDTIAKKIWRTDGQTFEVISDFRIQTFLNENIILSEDDKKPMIGLKNVKTHYNKFKRDVIFTFYDSTKDTNEVSWSICYNEIQDFWTSRYSWIPSHSENITNIFFSFNRDTSKKLALTGYTNYDNPDSLGITLKGKLETFEKNIGANTISRVSTNAINIVSILPHIVGTFKMKGYDYYNDYILKYELIDTWDHEYFEIDIESNEYVLKWKGTEGFEKYFYQLLVKVEMYSLLNGVEIKVQEFNDILGIKVSRDLIWSINGDLEEYDVEFSTWFWKHGQAGLFDIQTEILPTKWYDKQEPFEFEFVFVDNPSIHKIVDDLRILSNNAEPDSFEFEVTKDAYNLVNLEDYETVDHKTNILEKDIKAYQKGKDIKQYGRMWGNMTYLENFWLVEVKPFRFIKGDEVRSSRIRDKYCKIRVKYSGQKLAIISALQILYTQSYV